MNYKHLFPSYRQRWLFVKELLEDLHGVRPAQRMLHVGAGEGDIDRLLAGYAREVVSCDINPDDVAFAAQLNADLAHVKYAVEDGTALSFSDASFDTVVCLETIEHVDDPERLLSELARVLRPGGALVLTCPSHDFPITYDPINTLLRPIAGKTLPIGAYAYGHSWLVREDELRSWLAAKGFEVARSKHLSGTFAGLVEMYVPGIAQKLLKSNSANRAEAGAKAFAVKPDTRPPPLLPLVDAFARLDDVIAARGKRSIGLGYLCRKPKANGG